MLVTGDWQCLDIHMVISIVTNCWKKTQSRHTQNHGGVVGRVGWVENGGPEWRRLVRVPPEMVIRLWPIGVRKIFILLVKYLWITVLYKIFTQTRE